MYNRGHILHTAAIVAQGGRRPLRVSRCFLESHVLSLKDQKLSEEFWGKNVKALPLL